MNRQLVGRFSRWIGAGLGCLLLNSCFETEQEFTLNPDGTGKVVVESLAPNISLNGKSDLSEEGLKKAVATFIKETKGIEVWKDVSYSWSEDGRLKFKGTGYFSDISELDFHNQGMMGFSWSSDGQKGALAVDFKENQNAGEQKKLPEDPAEREAAIKAERQKFQQSKPMLTGFLAGLKHKAVFHLPGKDAGMVNFSPAESGAIAVEITGEKMLSTMEKLVNDDKWIAENGFDMQQGPSNMESMAELLFGEKGAVKAERTGMDKPLFDYAAEVAAARKEYPKLEEALGTTIAAPAEGQPFTSLDVMGVRMVYAVDETMNFRPFNSEPGYAISLLGKLPGSVLSVTDETRLVKAIAGDGSDLLPDNEWSRKVSFPNLSEDRSSVMFEVQMKAPAEGVETIREVSGILQYTVSSGVKETDLEMESLKVGGKGKELGAEIMEIKDGWQNDGSKEMEIKLSTEIDAIKSMLLVDGSKRVELEKRGSSSFGDGPITMNFEAKDGFPENGKLVIVLHDGVKTFDVPFKLENLTLLGKPATK